MKATFAVAAAFAPLALAQMDNSQAVIGYINSTIKDISSLNSTLNQFANDATDIGFNAIGLLGGSTSLQKDISNTTTAAQSSSQFGQSKEIFDSLFNLVEPTFELLDNFVAHCKAFENTNLKSAVLTQLSAQYSSVQDETNQLVSKLAQPYASSASVGGKLFVRGFNSVINVFNNPCGSAAAGCAAGGAGSGSGATTKAGGAAGGAGGVSTSAKSSVGSFVPNTINPNHFTGAAHKKRSPIASLLAML